MDKVVVPDVYQMRASEVKQFQTDELSLVCAAHKWPGNRSLRHYIRQIKRNVEINTPPNWYSRDRVACNVEGTGLAPATR
jgi:hypothetical protein